MKQKKVIYWPRSHLTYAKMNVCLSSPLVFHVFVISWSCEGPPVCFRLYPTRRKTPGFPV